METNYRETRDSKLSKKKVRIKQGRVHNGTTVVIFSESLNFLEP